MSVLITGGLGFIGSNVTKELLNNNEDVIIIDNLSNSLLVTYKNIKDITHKNFKLYSRDLLNKESLIQIFKENLDSFKKRKRVSNPKFETITTNQFYN